MKETKRTTRPREGYHWFRGWRQPSTAQRRVLDELLAGGTYAEIATRLGISEDGVKWHLSELREELGLEDRRQLAEWWSGHRRRAGIFAPLAGLGRLVSRQAPAAGAVTAVAAASLIIGWLAYANLRGDDVAPAAPLALSTPSSAPAVLQPAPTATAVAPTALIFDVDGGVTSLPGDLIGRRWLDAEAMRFVGITSRGPALIDAAGNLTVIEAASTDYYPVQDGDRVVLWRWLDGRLSSLDPATMVEQPLLDLGREDAGTRVWAIAASAARIAVSDRDRSHLRVLDFDTGRVQYEQGLPANEGIIHVAWSPDQSRLLVLLGRRDEAGRLAAVHRFVVLDATGRPALERQAVARWAGSAWLLVTPANPAGPIAGSSVYLSVLDGAEVPAGDVSALTCVSPDSRHAVFVREVAAGGAARPQFRHQLRALNGGEVVAQADSPQSFVNCDWTADSRRVVLSPGGK